ncbi:g2513 [Coccomyxa viridis]|uniref:G2513 protein n=1 Tax=Coccomyxa viridis TaxID=1274662 RepID=A0ABP1FKK7_9CHLO
MCAREDRSAAMQEPADEEAFRAQLRRISHFFDRLVDMVPAKHYVDDSREDAGPLKYLKKGAKLEAKQQRKEAAKKRKRENLDPDKQQSTLEVQREQALRRKGQHEQDEGAIAPSTGAQQQHVLPTEATAPSDLRFDVPTGADPSSAELRQKLHGRIEDMRKQRKAAEKKKQRAKAAKDWRDKASGRAKPLSTAKREKKAGATKRSGEEQAKKQNAKPALQQNVEDEADAKLSFGRIEIDKGGRPHKDAKKGKASKAELLESAKRRQEQLKSLEGTREGRLAVEQDAWNAALARARGERILDDPKLLSRSLKKEEKLRSKKTAAWKERKGLQVKDQKMKQKKRNDALKTRADGKIQKRKDKREKKLMRAGFEGRRDTPLGT